MDYGVDEQRAPERRYITRWRLEKKDPAAAVSEPVKPIVYYVDPATPTKLVPYIKKGIEQWQPAFEAAGFRNAIVAKDAPANDADWNPEDARYSVVRWLPSTIENASGPHVNDPRTGEILESDIQMYHNIMNLQRSWYFTQVGPLDARDADAADARRSDGRTGAVRGRARGRAHARLPAQHEGELALSGREAPRRGVAEDDGPHADADGLLALQLRGAARGQGRRRRSSSRGSARTTCSRRSGATRRSRARRRQTPRRRPSTSGRGRRTPRRGCASRRPAASAAIRAN